MREVPREFNSFFKFWKNFILIWNRSVFLKKLIFKLFYLFLNFYFFACELGMKLCVLELLFLNKTMTMDLFVSSNLYIISFT